MYIANREFKAAGKDGKLKLYKPGDEIPDFESWSETAKRANLNVEFVVKVEGKAAKLEPRPTKPQAVEKKTAPKKAAPKKAEKKAPLKEKKAKKAPESHATPALK